MKKLSRLSCFFTFLLVMILTCSCFAEKPENSVTPVSAINFDVSEANIAKGGKIKVIATVEPNEADSKKVIWSMMFTAIWHLKNLSKRVFIILFMEIIVLKLVKMDVNI